MFREQSCIEALYYTLEKEGEALDGGLQPSISQRSAAPQMHYCSALCKVHTVWVGSGGSGGGQVVCSGGSRVRRQSPPSGSCTFPPNDMALDDQATVMLTWLGS